MNNANDAVNAAKLALREAFNAALDAAGPVNTLGRWQAELALRAKYDAAYAAINAMAK